jgi:hypothetical protein
VSDDSADYIDAQVWRLVSHLLATPDDERTGFTMATVLAIRTSDPEHLALLLVAAVVELAAMVEAMVDSGIAERWEDLVATMMPG